MKVLEYSPKYPVTSFSGTIHTGFFYSCTVPAGLNLGWLSQPAQGGNADAKLTMLQISYALGEGVGKPAGKAREQPGVDWILVSKSNKHDLRRVVFRRGKYAQIQGP